MYYPFFASDTKYRLLLHVLLYFVSLYCKHYAPRSDCSLRRSLIRVHRVCYHDKSSLECIWRYAADVNQGSHGQGKVSEKWKKFKVREKSGNFDLTQGNLKFWKKSGKSQRISWQLLVIYFGMLYNVITVQFSRSMCLNSRDVQTFRQNMI